MKYRIIECKDSKGKVFYEIQKRFLWIWWNLCYDNIDEFSWNKIKIKKERFCFKSIGEAKETLERYNKTYEYRGHFIYPTINRNIFYVLDWRETCDQKGFYEYYSYLIHGTYKECCEKIDRNLEKNSYEIDTRVVEEII